MCIGRVSPGNRTLEGIQRRGRVGLASSSSILAGPSSSSSPRYCHNHVKMNKSYTLLCLLYTEVFPPTKIVGLQPSDPLI